MGAISCIIWIESIDLFGKALNSVCLKQNECVCLKIAIKIDGERELNIYERKLNNGTMGRYFRYLLFFTILCQFQ